MILNFGKERCHELQTTRKEHISMLLKLSPDTHHYSIFIHGFSSGHRHPTTLARLDFTFNRMKGYRLQTMEDTIQGIWSAKKILLIVSIGLG